MLSVLGFSQVAFLHVAHILEQYQKKFSGTKQELY